MCKNLQGIQQGQKIQNRFSRTPSNCQKPLKKKPNDFVYAMITGMDSEGDPRNLMFLFQFVPEAYSQFPLEHLAEEAFSVLECYFPIDFTQISGCDVWNVADISSRVDELWKTLKPHVLQSGDNDVTQLALQAITRILRRFCTSPLSASESETLDNLLKSVTRETHRFLSDPTLTLFLPSTKVLIAVSQASAICCEYVVKTVVPQLLALADGPEKKNDAALVALSHILASSVQRSVWDSNSDTIDSKRKKLLTFCWCCEIPSFTSLCCDKLMFFLESRQSPDLVVEYETDRVLERIMTTVDDGIDTEIGSNCVDLLAWTVKSLILRNHKSSTNWMRKLVSFIDKEAVSVDAARGFKKILSDRDELSPSNFCSQRSCPTWWRIWTIKSDWCAKKRPKQDLAGCWLAQPRDEINLAFLVLLAVLLSGTQPAGRLVERHSANQTRSPRLDPPTDGSSCWPRWIRLSNVSGRVEPFV
ncbi:unnamed protein product [Nesidiocoris tenuis]|uniref:MMS19 nucleotide excision repair protein n=1 Tax=Nesidiocoris tenuis TaxID=355587 RepID=A0A6H5G545_9HEMI|nr:unnamed protein product [Nesidiocoris tenuis]